MITGTYKNIPFRCAFEHVLYEYWDDDGDGGRTRRTGTLFRGLIAEVPFRKISRSMLGLEANSDIQMRNNLVDREENSRRADIGIIDTENAQFNMLFNIISSDEENMFYILTPDVMERLVVLYSKYKNMLHLAFEGDKMYICISAGDSYLRFKEENPTDEAVSKIGNKINSDLAKIADMLDAAMTI